MTDSSAPTVASSGLTPRLVTVNPAMVVAAETRMP